MNNHIDGNKENFQNMLVTFVKKELNENIGSVKDFVIDALQEENFKLQKKSKILKTNCLTLKLQERNNMEVKGINCY